MTTLNSKTAPCKHVEPHLNVSLSFDMQLHAFYAFIFTNRDQWKPMRDKCARMLWV